MLKDHELALQWSKKAFDYDCQGEILKASQYYAKAEHIIRTEIRSFEKSENEARVFAAFHESLIGRILQIKRETIASEGFSSHKNQNLAIVEERKQVKLGIVQDVDNDDVASRVIREVLEVHVNTAWESISGLEGVKETLVEAIVLPSVFPSYFTGIRRPWRGILLFGAPGTGKTLLAKAVATQCNSAFFNVTLSSIGSKWMGESEKIIKCIFEKARSCPNATVFIDEIDSICGMRGGDSEHEASRRIKAEILVQMDGINSSGG